MHPGADRLKRAKQAQQVDEEIIHCSELWQNFPAPTTEDSARRQIERAPELYEEHDRNDLLLSIQREVWAWYWADAGFPTLRASQSYAAALMATDPAARMQQDLLIPWRAFRVEVPAGLLDLPGIEVRWLYVCCPVDGPAALTFSNVKWYSRPRYYDEMMKVNERGERISDPLITRIRMHNDLGSILFDREDSDLALIDRMMGTAPPTEESATESLDRIALLASNYVAGLLYTMQHTRDWKQSDHRHKLRRPIYQGRRAPPVHRNVICGRPIAVNLAGLIHAQVLGKSRGYAPAMFQSLVRGHYKRQVIGVGRGGRKVIWVEPYWRGPELAPIFVRPYEVGGSKH